MTSRLIKVLSGAICASALCWTPVVLLEAANIITPLGSCMPWDAHQPETWHLDGVSNNPNVDMGPQTVLLNCDVPRSPLPAGAAVAQFWVDGDNNGSNTRTECTLFSKNFNGQLLGGTSFSAGPGTYDRLLTLPANLVRPGPTRTCDARFPGAGRLPGP